MMLWQGLVYEKNTRDFTGVQPHQILNHNIPAIKTHQRGRAGGALRGEHFRVKICENGEYFLRTMFVQENRQRMRYFLLVMQPKAYLERQITEDRIWSLILSGVKVVRLVAKQPFDISTTANFWEGGAKHE